MRSNCCDNCAKGLSNWKLNDLYVGIDDHGQYNFALDGGLVINAIKCMEMCKTNPTQKSIGELMIGNTRNRKLMALPQYGKGSGKPKYYWYAMVDQLMFTDHIDFVAGETRLKLTAIGENWRNRNAPKMLKLKPLGAIYNYIERKQSTPFTYTGSSHNEHEYEDFSMYDSSHIMNLFFGNCVLCG